MSKGKGGSKNDLYAGLETKTPGFPDKSSGMKGPSVDKDAKRTKVAETPASLGPRRLG
jgi:hypothetical protein